MKKVLGTVVLLVAIGGVFFLVQENDQGEIVENIVELDLNEPAPMAEVKEAIKRYDIEAATVVYEYTGMQQGREMLSFDQWGLREHKDARLSMNIGSFSESTDTVTIFLSGNIINYDRTKRTGTKLQQPSFLVGAGQGLEAKNQDIREVGEDVLASMGGIQEGTQTILGRKCDMWQLDQIGTTVCIRNGLILESTVDFMGQSQQIRAVSLVEGPIKDDLFIIPTNIDFSASASAQQVMNEFFEQAQ